VAAFPFTQPAISRHLRVLRERGVVEEQRPAGDRRVRVYRLQPQAFDALAGWLDEVRRFWTGHLDQLRSFVEEEAARRAREEP